MKSRIESGIEIKLDKYPYVGVSENYEGLTVLFTSENSGICLVSGSTTHKIGYVSGTWAEHNFKRRAIATITFES